MARAIGLHVESAALSGEAEKQTLEISARSAPLPFEHPDVIVEGPDGFAFGPPEVVLSADGGAASFSLPVIVNAGRRCKHACEIERDTDAGRRSARS